MNSIDQIIRKLLEEEHDLLSEIDKYREEGDVESEIFARAEWLRSGRSEILFFQNRGRKYGKRSVDDPAAFKCDMCTL